MAEIYFHDLPVYRVREDLYYSRRDEEIARSVADAFRGFRSSPDAIERMRKGMEQHHYDKFGPWTFNEIVGFVRLHFSGSQVRGEYFAPRKTRAVKTRTKTFIYRTHKLAPEQHIPIRATNEDVLGVILEYVDDCRREYPRRHFDDEWLRTVGPFVDWNGLRSRRNVSAEP